jgi:hypothetical protein
MTFSFAYLDEINFVCQTDLVYESKDQMGSFYEQIKSKKSYECTPSIAQHKFLLLKLLAIFLIAQHPPPPQYNFY